MLPDIQRTIVALATAPRPAERAIVRLAGPDTRQILGKLCENLPSEFLDRDSLQWCDCQCPLPIAQNTLPITLLYWPTNRSYTGSPAAEIHMLGCVPLAEAVINRCCELGAEPAQRGEFTLRAFLAGKLDLAQAEAVLGVIEADSRQSLQAALSQLGGNLAPAIAPLRSNLIDVVAELEAGLDFVDEDIQFISQEQVIAQLQTVSRQLEEFASRLDTRSSTDRVPQVVLTGLPNSGKSSLFNAICQQPLAIVADLPGTTRDYLQHRINFIGPVGRNKAPVGRNKAPVGRNKAPVGRNKALRSSGNNPVGRNKALRSSGDSPSAEFDLVDTAGWEELSGLTPRAMAQEQLAKCLEQAQLGLLCIDMSSPNVDLEAWRELKSSMPKQSWLIVGTKRDLVSDHELESSQSFLEHARNIIGADNVVTTCCSSSESIVELSESIAVSLQDLEKVASLRDGHEPLSVVHETAVRCRAALTAARSGIAAALEMAETGGGEELIAAELRLVLHDLATIIGEVHSDDVLGEIFSRFCIGK